MASGRDESFSELVGEVRRLFHQLAASANALHEREGVAAAHRGVLESLCNGGEQTVPALARARPVSRQHIQALVNDLSEWNLVEAVPNPAHQRSPLIRVTARGRARFEAMRERERRWLAATRLPVSAAEMRAAADTLERLRVHLAKRTEMSLADTS